MEAFRPVHASDFWSSQNGFGHPAINTCTSYDVQLFGDAPVPSSVHHTMTPFSISYSYFNKLQIF